MSDDNEVAEAVRDLTRVVLALQGDFPTAADAIRKLKSLGIPDTRVALLLGLKHNAVTSVVAKDKKRNGNGVKKNGK